MFYYIKINCVSHISHMERISHFINVDFLAPNLKYHYILVIVGHTFQTGAYLLTPKSVRLFMKVVVEVVLSLRS